MTAARRGTSGIEPYRKAALSTVRCPPPFVSPHKLSISDWRARERRGISPFRVRQRNLGMPAHSIPAADTPLFERRLSITTEPCVFRLRF